MGQTPTMDSSRNQVVISTSKNENFDTPIQPRGQPPSSINAIVTSSDVKDAGITSQANAIEDAVSKIGSAEGGLKAWSVVVGSWCALFASLGLMNTLGTFQAYVSTHQLKGVSEGTIGWIFSIYTFMAWFCGVFIGPIFDKYGPRWLILVGSIFLVGSMILLGECSGKSLDSLNSIPLASLVKAYWHFVVVFGIMGGLGTALLFTPSIAAIGHYFDAKRGTATGIACTGGSIGGIVFPFMIEGLVFKVGFAWCVRIVGVLCLLLCIAANILITSRVSLFKTADASPDLRIFKNIPFSITTAGVFLIEWGLFVPITYISSYALRQGFSQEFAFQILPIMNVGSFFGRWIPGFCADKFGRYNTIIAAVVLNILSVFCFWLPLGSSIAGLVIFALLFGFASGANVSVTPVCIGQLCPTESYGRYYATCYTVVAFGCLTGVPIAGEILVRDDGRYWGLMLFVGICYIGALIALASTRFKATGWKLYVIY